MAARPPGSPAPGGPEPSQPRRAEPGPARPGGGCAAAALAVSARQLHNGARGGRGAALVAGRVQRQTRPERGRAQPGRQRG